MTLYINKVTPPGTLKRVELHPDKVIVQVRNEPERVYRLVPAKVEAR